jgi:hypothetical protein
LSRLRSRGTVKNVGKQCKRDEHGVVFRTAART